jgi:multidrug efflux system membrane fusion protein
MDSMKAMKRLIQTLLMASSLFATLAGAQEPATAPTAPPAAKASLQWAQRVELSTLVSGNIAEVNVDVGSRVKAGAVLLRLDQRGFKAQLAKAKADNIHAKDALDEAKRELDRSQELFDRTVLSIHDLQLVKIALARAKADYRGTQAALEQAKLNLEHSTIRAPYDGVVLHRQAQVGQTVISRLQATPLLVLARADRMIARAGVVRKDLDRLKVGDTLPVKVGGTSFDGKVVRLGMEPMPEEVGPEPVYAVDVAFTPPASGDLRAGQQASVQLP